VQAARSMQQGNEKLVKSFTDLDAWRKAHQLVVRTYKITADFPKEEVFGIVNQMRRCAVSVTSNIAEGFSRQFGKEKIQFYSMAIGSLTELQNQLMISKDVKYLTDSSFQEIYDQSVEIHKMLNGLIKSTRRRTS